MSSIVDALYELKYNPFHYGPYFASFYTQLNTTENNLLLAQLVIPLCSHPIYKSKLLNSNTRSSMWSVFDDRAKLYDLQERIEVFKTLTEQCIQYCLVNDWLSVNKKTLSLEKFDAGDSNFISQKTARNLGRLFSGYSVVEIYASLGVRPQ